MGSLYSNHYNEHYNDLSDSNYYYVNSMFRDQSIRLTDAQKNIYEEYIKIQRAFKDDKVELVKNTLVFVESIYQEDSSNNNIIDGMILSLIMQDHMANSMIPNKYLNANVSKASVIMKNINEKYKALEDPRCKYDNLHEQPRRIKDQIFQSKNKINKELKNFNIAVKNRENTVFNPIIESFSKDCELFIQEKYRTICREELDIVKKIPHDVENYRLYTEPKEEAINNFLSMHYVNMGDECEELEVVNLNRQITEIYNDLSNSGLSGLANLFIGIGHYITDNIE